MIEHNIIENMQKYPFKNLMIFISLPFEPILFPFIILITKKYLNLNKNNIIVLLLSHFIVFLLKRKTNRVRPYNKYPNRIKNKFIYNLNDNSMPSGHAFTSYLLCWLISIKLKNNCLMIIPILVCISRVWLGVHYPSDVIVGLILGKITSTLLKQ